MPEIVVIDPNHVTIDGEPAGCVFDVIVNHAQIVGIKGLVHGQLVAAWQALDTARLQAVKDGADATAAKLSSVCEGHAREVLEIHAKHQEELAKHREAQVLTERKLEEHQEYVTAVAGMPVARELARQAKRAALETQRREIEAAQAALDADDADAGEGS